MLKKAITAIFIAVLLTGIAIAAAYTPIMKSRYPLKYDGIIARCADEFELPPELVAAMIFCESSFRENAESKAGAKGLMQLTPDTYDWLSRLMGDRFPGGEITDPETNITCGCYYLRYMIDKFGSVESAVAGYNAGHGAVGRWLADEKYSDDGTHLKSIPYPETEKYVEKVMKIKETYKELYYKEK